MGKGRIIICSECGRERQNAKQGRCKTCVQREARQVVGLCTCCQRQRQAISGGLCGPCRIKNYRARQGAAYREKHARYERERRKQMNEEYRVKERKRYVRRHDQRLVYNREYYQRNAERLREYQSEYRKTHPEWRDHVKQLYLARKKGLPSTLTVKEWKEIKAAFNHCCAYCGRYMERLTKDHVIPVTSGGGFTAENIVPACTSCNSRKHNRDADTYMAEIAAGKHDDLFS